MLDFVKRSFRNGIEVILWINLILSTIIGGFAGYYIGQLINYRNAGGYTFLGVLIGLIIGLLMDIVGGGFIVTIICIERNIKMQNQLQKKLLIHFGISEKIIDNIIETDESREKTEEVNNTISVDEKLLNNKIKIKRIKNDSGSAIPIEIIIDGKNPLELLHDDEKILDIVNGNHLIVACYYGDEVKAEFVINNDSKIINIFTSPKLNIKMNK
ncbi:MAG: hypothetical protein FWC19_02580 [Treponema sp.]|nr:hypothetical protein [Treponema sp.]